MAKKSVWFEQADPTAPVHTVARQALQRRLTHVVRYLRHAALRSQDDDEYVHEARVATRRSTAALDVFQQCLPPKRGRNIKQQLKQTRKAAGEARDLDVILHELDQRESLPRTLVTAVRLQRQVAQRPLLQAWRQCKSENWKRKFQKLLKRIGWRGQGEEPTYRELASTTIGQHLDAFIAAGSADLQEIAALHEMRIAGKRLRYSLELLSGALNGRVLDDQIYPVFVVVQDKLGAINDHASAAVMFNGWRSVCRDQELVRALDQLINEHRHRLDQRQADFLDWWTTERRDKMRDEFQHLVGRRPVHVT